MPTSTGTDPEKLAEIGKTLAEALPYMREFNGQTFVVKLADMPLATMT